MAQAPGDDRIVETGIRQEANHPSASPRQHLPQQTPELLFDLGRRWMGSGESILLALARRNVLFDFSLLTQVEGERTVNLLDAQCPIMRSDCLRGLATLKLSHDVCQGHTTSDEVEALIPAFDEFHDHGRACL